MRRAYYLCFSQFTFAFLKAPSMPKKAVCVFITMFISTGEWASALYVTYYGCKSRRTYFLWRPPSFYSSDPPACTFVTLKYITDHNNNAFACRHWYLRVVVCVRHHNANHFNNSRNRYSRSKEPIISKNFRLRNLFSAPVFTCGANLKRYVTILAATFCACTLYAFSIWEGNLPNGHWIRLYIFFKTRLRFGKGWSNALQQSYHQNKKYLNLKRNPRKNKKMYSFQCWRAKRYIIPGTCKTRYICAYNKYPLFLIVLTNWHSYLMLPVHAAP